MVVEVLPVFELLRQPRIGEMGAAPELIEGGALHALVLAINGMMALAL